MEAAEAAVLDELEELARGPGAGAAIHESLPGAEWNALEDAFLRRRSVRKYKAKQVPAHLVRRILEIGRYAPSQGNCQPWKFVVVRDKDMIARLERYCVDECKKLSRLLDYSHYAKGTLRRAVSRLTAGVFNRLDHNMLHPVPVSAVKAIAEGRFAVFHKAPTLIFPLMDKRGVGSPEVDIGIVGTNIVMAAHSHGLGSCWVGFSKLLARNKELSEMLGAVWPYEIVETIALGYPIGDPTQNHVPRQTHEITWWEDGKKQILY